VEVGRGKTGSRRKIPSTKHDELVKSLETVMPDLIRHPEFYEFTGFRLSPE
jgi:hypothetical protein